MLSIHYLHEEHGEEEIHGHPAARKRSRKKIYVFSVSERKDFEAGYWAGTDDPFHTCVVI